VGDKANDNYSDNTSKSGSIKDHFSKIAEKDLDDEIAFDDKIASIFLIVVNSLFGICFILHQMNSTGFFPPNFNTPEAIMLYGIPVYWITTSILILIGQKHPSRDLDTYGGLFFATFAIGWLILVFPFKFANFAHVLPDFLRFLFQWISNEIAIAALVILFVIHLALAIYSLIIRMYVRKARVKLKIR
jgi:hypothetical protein